MRINNLTKVEVAQLREKGFTVAGQNSAITGGIDNNIKRHLVGGKARLRLLRKLGVR